MRRIGAPIFPGFDLRDLFGPIEMFRLLKNDFDLKLIAETSEPISSNQQVRAFPDVTTKSIDHFDILFVRGGISTRREVEDMALLDWIRTHSVSAQYVLSICTGSLLLADAGVLNGRRAMTNNAAFRTITDKYTKTDCLKQARWVEDGKFITSSGVSAGMDMALSAIVGRTHSPKGC